MLELNEQTWLHVPALARKDRKEWSLFIDGESPNWVSVDARGAWLLQQLAESPRLFSTMVGRYGAHTGLETGKAWVHAQAFMSEAVRHGIVSLAPVTPRPYEGRSRYLSVSRLRECWLHLNNSCNLRCAHCLVSSSPRGEPGLPTATWRSLIDQAAALGVDRFYVTGGEPFVRPDLIELIRRDRKSTRLNSSHSDRSRMPSSA